MALAFATFDVWGLVYLGRSGWLELGTLMFVGLVFRLLGLALSGLLLLSVKENGLFGVECWV